MNTCTRIGITLASALALGAAEAGRILSQGTPGLEHEIWGWATLAGYGIAILGVALVNRWWALLPVAVPMVVSASIYNLTDYTSPWESESIHPTAGALVILLPLAIGLQVAFLSLGFLFRRIWLRGRDWYQSRPHDFGAGRLGS